MPVLPLIHAEHVGRIARLADSHGVPGDRYLSRAHLPAGVRRQESGFVPARSVWELAGALDAGEALGDFWLDVARLSGWRRAGWVRPLTRTVTLGDAIRAMCRSYARQIPMNELGLEVNGTTSWFWRRRLTNVRHWPGGSPAEQYTLSFMLEVIRAAAGEEWLPTRIQVECAASGWCAERPRFSGVQFVTDRPMLALAIPTPMLSLPVAIEALPTEGSEPDSAPADVAGCLHALLEACIESGLPDQDEAAEMVWMSPRTLRRQLAAEGTGWLEVLGDVKFARAVARLQEGRASVREIAQELGYSDRAHFARFFRSRAGVAPTAYHEQIARARALARRRLH